MRPPRVQREKLLHQALLVGLERGEFFSSGGDEVVEGSEAVGDILLFFIFGRT